MIRLRHWLVVSVSLFFMVMYLSLPAAGKDTMKLLITLDKGTVEGLLDTTPVTEQLLKLSPMAIEMKDFNHQEKIGYPPEKLNINNAKSGFTPKTGDIGIYAPWGNFCIFYHDADYSEGLIYLGKVVSGLDILKNERNTFKTNWNISKVNQNK